MICYWPSDEVAGNQKRLIDLVTKKAVVDKTTWGKFNITILDTYEGAQSHLENAINGEVVVSTDLENRGKRGRLKKKFKLAVAKAVIEPSHTS